MRAIVSASGSQLSIGHVRSKRGGAFDTGQEDAPFQLERAWLATVAHELRGPLNALAASSELLDSAFDDLDDDQMRRAISGIRSGALWMRDLLENLTCSAAIRERRFTVDRRELRATDVIDETRPLVEPILNRKAQALRVSVRGAIPIVLADARRIEQALVNLILNASKFSPMGSPIDLRLVGRPRSVRFSVADRGPGIPAEFRDSVFEPFFQLDRNGDRSGGVGLGLAIVRAIVHAHEGSIGVEPRRGGGTQVWFSIRSHV